jgi:hypothetical protein
MRLVNPFSFWAPLNFCPPSLFSQFFYNSALFLDEAGHSLNLIGIQRWWQDWLDRLWFRDVFYKYRCSLPLRAR